METSDDPAALLLVEDDRQLSELLTELLTGAGYSVDAAFDGQAGLHRALTRRYAVMVVDRGLPAIEGTQLVAKLRAQGVTTPALMLTARGALDDVVEGLDAGAEDYLVKPFEIPELLARLRALLRRHSDSADSIDLGGRRLDIAARRVFGDGQPPVELSSRECDLLRILAGRPSRVFSRSELMDRVFGAAENPGAVDTYVHYLRRKLGKDAIETVRGLGYRMGRV
ncbi:MAG: two-component system, OmpR family, response regulator QseB [Cryptosporangiaceae bacterium]|jgi:DNA-binding response OmpR family regulator|nr:two-component system, OmpR family, response regulator QseB [Cryptosporangiaceae bacterium]MDQ1658321.1 two-component system, OmpR family, response regulator QseB [Cryptosporangiaceae bacterium]